MNQTSLLSKLASIKVDDDAILVIALFILLSAAVMGAYWYMRGLRPLGAALRGLTAELKGVNALESRQAQRLPESLTSSSPGLNEVWHETVARIVWLPGSQGQHPVLLSSPRDLWTPARLLAGRVNLGLAEAMPNLLVGLGLLCTFFFLTLALSGATSALMASGKEQTQLIDATRELLRTAGGKFITSLAGLFASVVWTIAAKWLMDKLEQACDDLLRELERLAPFTGGELALAAQFSQFSAMHEKLVAQHAAAMVAVDEAKAHKAVSDELLAETHELVQIGNEQSATFKSFSTDLAVSMGQAIDTALAPRFEAMTGQLVAALDKLTERIGTINQESLDRMAHEHAKRLAEATKQEMEEFKLALVDLAGRLSSAGGVINQSAGEAAKSLGDAGLALKSQMDETGAAFSTQFATAAQALHDAAGGTAGQLDAAGKQLAQGVTAAGAEIAAAAQGAAEAFRGGIDSASNQLQQAGMTAAQALSESAVSTAGHLDTAGKQLAQGVTAAGAEITAAAQGAAEALRSGIESAANRLQQAGQNAAASIDIAGTTLKLQSENMAVTMAAQVDQCAQALARASSGVEASMGMVMRQLGEAAAQASQQWAGGVTSAVDLLTMGARQASDVLGQSTTEASKAFDVSAAELARQAGLFGQVMSDKLNEVATATSTMNREVQGIAKAAQELAAQGIDGANRFNAAMERTGLVVNTLGELAGTWEPLVASLRGAAQEVRAATQPMGDMVKSLNALGADLMTRSPQALAAIQQVTQLLSQAAQQTRDAMDGSRRALDDTSKTLHKTVAEMREGVGAYSGQVAALHLQLDAALAKAISGINGSVNNMSGAIEALNDSFGRLPLRS